MVKKDAAVLGLVIFLATLPATIQAQDAKTFLSTVAKAMGADNLKTLQYSGMGSHFDASLGATPEAPSSLARVKSYKRDLDLSAPASRVDMVSVQNKTDHAVTQTIVPNSPWDIQYDFWLTPYGFLKGAATHDVTLKPETVFGEKYKVVSFMVQEKYKVSGYINEKNMVERVETRLDNNVLMQGVYLLYEDFGGLKFPTTIVQKQDGNNTLILIVDSVKANAPVNIPRASGD